LSQQEHIILIVNFVEIGVDEVGIILLKLHGDIFGVLEFEFLAAI
jgi:hypothetical protein